MSGQFDYGLAFTTGLFGALHCLGMCGGLAAGCAVGHGSRRPLLSLLQYQGGRILLYTLWGVAGALARPGGALGLLGGPGHAVGVGAMMPPGKGWLPASDAACHGDGTPLQFIPKTEPDPDPLRDELKKYPKCPYCGMDRTKWNQSRHLVHYDDNLVDGTCSIHCLAISLSLNLDRGSKAIYAADFSSVNDIKPLMKVDQVRYLIGAKLRRTMTKTSKMAFASEASARAAQIRQGGELADISSALRETYLGMAEDTLGVRRRRAERRKKTMKQKQD